MRLLAFITIFGICLDAVAAQPQRVIRLWPEGMPENQQLHTVLSITERGDPAHIRDRYAESITDPHVIAFPAQQPNGQALLIIPGGGYSRVVMDKEGYEAAEWYSKRGISCFVLIYRLPGDGWSNRSDVPLQDAQRALRLVRAEAATYGYDPTRIGVMGFSAGGHVAASLAAAFDREVYSAGDPYDEFSARPGFAILLYPVVSMDPAIAHAGSREKLLGNNPTKEQEQRYSIEHQLTADMPPVFLLHAADDESVSVDNSLRLFRALRDAGIQADLHVFSEGGHGFGLRYATDKPVFEWPNLVWRWMQELD